MGSGYAAGSAPGGPEIDQHGDAGFADDLVELSGTDGDGLRDGRQWIFAVAAAAGVGEVTRGDAIRFVAMSAGAKDGHSVLLHYGCG
jgi:hypothetical protein